MRKCKHDQFKKPFYMNMQFEGQDTLHYRFLQCLSCGEVIDKELFDVKGPDLNDNSKKINMVIRSGGFGIPCRIYEY